jgi:NAD+ synthase
LIGTTDKTEYTVGHYDVHGDGANDITLLRHLYKTQIKKLAQYIGVPKEITDKPSSGDLFGNLPNEVTFGISYEQLDNLLSAIERNRPEKELVKIVPLKFVKDFKKSIEIAKLSRSLPLALD